MAESGLDSLAETHAIAVTWKAYELRPEEAPPMSPAEQERFQAYLRQGWPRVAGVARERFGLELSEPPFRPGLRTRLTHTAAKAAEALGRGEAFRRAIFRAYWLEGRDIGAEAVLADLARQAGLDEAAFRAAWQDDPYRSAVVADLQWAYQAGLGGVPAFIFGERYLVSGALPVELLRQVADRCLAEGRTL
jgi:predicted DsbA family dithiol-disulfide isomerase